MILYTSMRKFLTKKRIIIGLLLLVIVGLVFRAKNGENGKEYLSVERADVVEKIVVTGKVKALSSVDLGFDRTGRVVRSYKVVGDSVSQGEVIAELDVSSELADLSKQRAILAEERAKLGGSKEALLSSLREGFAASDNAVRNKADQFFKEPRTNPVFEIKFTDGNYVHYFNVPTSISLELNNMRRGIENDLSAWQKELGTMTPENAVNFADSAVAKLNRVSDFLDKMAFAVNSFTSADFAYESTVAGYKTAVDSARSSVNTARNAVIADKEAVSQIGNIGSVGEARVAQINATIASIEALIAKSRIVAPFAGTITLQDAKVGSIASPGSKLVSIISESDLSLEANISEVNIGKVEVGDRAVVEFDSFPGETFEGIVAYIEPGETLIDGVVYYKTRVTIAQNEKVRSGMTANLEIETDRKVGVLAVPGFAIEKQDGKAYVNKVEGENVVRTEVQVGSVGSDGANEIVGGLSEGDKLQYGGK